MPLKIKMNIGRLRELLEYDPVTGFLTWKSPTPKSASEGGRAGALAPAGSRYQFRRFIQIDLNRLPAHRVAWALATGELPNGYVVPKNGDYDDLRFENLSLLSAADAARRGGVNRSNTSGHRGITWVADRERWFAYITHNYKRYHVGYFKTIEDAVAARDERARELGAQPINDRSDIDFMAAIVNRDARLRVLWRKVHRRTNGITKWHDFAAFAESIGDLPLATGEKRYLEPIRPDETIGPDNFKWAVQTAKWDYSTRDGKEAYRRAHRALHRNSYRDKSLRGAFGLSLAEYEAMLAAQGHACASCGGRETTKRKGKDLWLAVDHCHTTGSIRGLLCGACNKGLGHFKDDPKLLRAAADYLERAVTTSNGVASSPLERRSA